MTATAVTVAKTAEKQAHLTITEKGVQYKHREMNDTHSSKSVISRTVMCMSLRGEMR